MAADADPFFIGVSDLHFSIGSRSLVCLEKNDLIALKAACSSENFT